MLAYSVIRKHSLRDGFECGKKKGYDDGYSDGTKDLANYVLNELGEKCHKGGE